MDPQARLHLWVLIVAFGLVFIWGALIPTYFGFVSFSSQSLDAGLTGSGAAPLAAMDTGFILVFMLGGVLTILFIGLVWRLAQQPPQREVNETTT